MALPSRRPYLLRAMYDWMVDSRQTPHLLVDATLPGVSVPTGSVQDGRIVLNVGPHAAHRLRIGNDELEFDARFGGVSQHVVVPIVAVLAVYARETGQGMMFGPDDAAPLEGTPTSDAGAPEPPETDPPPKRRPTLKVVK